MDEKTGKKMDKVQGWQKTLGTTLALCITFWLSALLLMFMVWSLLWVYGSLFG